MSQNEGDLILLIFLLPESIIYPYNFQANEGKIQYYYNIILSQHEARPIIVNFLCWNMVNHYYSTGLNEARQLFSPLLGQFYIRKREMEISRITHLMYHRPRKVSGQQQNLILPSIYPDMKRPIKLQSVTINE